MRKAYKALCYVLTVTALCSRCKKEKPQETVTHEYYVNKDEFPESFTVWVDSIGNVSHLSIDVRDYVRYE